MTTRDELESRMGITPLEELLARRADLVAQVAPLRAKYGPGGTWDAQRKATVSTIAMRLRAQATAENRKLTEAAADDGAHADDDYVALVTQATLERAAMMVLDDQIQAVNDEIQRGNVLGRFAAAELHL